MHRGLATPSGTGSTWNMASPALVEQAWGPDSRIPQCRFRGPSSIGGSPCVSQPCLNNGTCEDHIRSYSCTCTPGYEGKTCAVGEAPPIPPIHEGLVGSHNSLLRHQRVPGNHVTLIPGGSLVPYSTPPWKSCHRCWLHPVTHCLAPALLKFS